MTKNTTARYQLWAGGGPYVRDYHTEDVFQRLAVEAAFKGNSDLMYCIEGDDKFYHLDSGDIRSEGISAGELQSLSDTMAALNKYMENAHYNTPDYVVQYDAVGDVVSVVAQNVVDGHLFEETAASAKDINSPSIFDFIDGVVAERVLECFANRMTCEAGDLAECRRECPNMPQTLRDYLAARANV